MFKDFPFLVPSSKMQCYKNIPLYNISAQQNFNKARQTHCIIIAHAVKKSLGGGSHASLLSNELLNHIGVSENYRRHIITFCELSLPSYLGCHAKIILFHVCALQLFHLIDIQHKQDGSISCAQNTVIIPNNVESLHFLGSNWDSQG